MMQNGHKSVNQTVMIKTKLLPIYKLLHLIKPTESVVYNNTNSQWPGISTKKRMSSVLQFIQTQ